MEWTDEASQDIDVVLREISFDQATAYVPFLEMVEQWPAPFLLLEMVEQWPAPFLTLLTIVHSVFHQYGA